MKIFVILVSLVYTLFAANAEDAAFALSFHEDYPTALAQAKKEKKLLVLVIVQDPCPYCDRMVENTLSDAKVQKVLEDFVCVIVDKHAPLPSAFHSTIAPMTFFIDPKDEEGIWESMGYASVESFLDDLNEARIIHNKK